MTGRTWAGLILSGLVAGVVYFLLTMLTLTFFAGGLLETLEDLPDYPKRSGAWFFAIDIGMGVWVLWLYVAISKRYGRGARTAVIAAAAWWIMKSLQSANWIGLGFVPSDVTLIPLATSLVSTLGGVLTGALLFEKLDRR
ncbi:MAG: hypothetical protein GTN89_15865 [Acidobacteria bacterium]|nr:hypothetical protein [Acidobacteriota bacterium]NIM62424.1 hypothetical protein [Acidobacteriota bacterium]NIO60718.1 hypothetical protein [Acidobacteriota bacterium]NIQ31783.1 hypothetical protein [Acidobacteriota bacterium]NIQ87089.1 hypothetical protein [Acidobacteriota bacterium]